MNTEQIQLHVLDQLAKTGNDVHRRVVAQTLGVKPTAVDDAMARCTLVCRVTANGGSFVRYRFA